MNQPVNPSDLAPPAANYHHAVLTPAGSTMLFTSGVVPTRPDGSVPSSLVEQADQVWANLLSIIGAAGFAVHEVVSITTYVIVGQELGEVMAARDRALDGHIAASTLVTVPALARGEWLVEIALVAAKTSS